MRPVVLVAAVAENGVIGNQGDIPWRLPADLAHFRRVTEDQTVVMGRKTAESLPGGKPLRGRRNLVLSTTWAADEHPGFEVFGSVDELRQKIWTGALYIIGGQEIYRAFEPLATHAEITHVEGSPLGDTRMPNLGSNWRLVSSQLRRFDQQNPLNVVFASYERVFDGKPIAPRVKNELLWTLGAG